MCTHAVITYIPTCHSPLLPFLLPMDSTASFTVNFVESDAGGSEGETVDVEIELEGGVFGSVHVKVLALTVSEFEAGNFGSVTSDDDPAESKWPCVASVLSPTINYTTLILLPSLPRSLSFPLFTQLLTSKFPRQTTHSLEVSMVWWTHQPIHSISI